jgi:uncharacterized protein
VHQKKTAVKSELLMIFSRYPIAGQAKTRLIPALGAAGAAQLQRQMTVQTLAMALHCQVPLQIRFCGGSQQQMQDWLGAEFDYQLQGEGDLGDRMARSFAAGFGAGYDRIIIIGTDCPQIEPDLIQAAFSQLHQKDLVLGVAADGGYYLIGLRQMLPEIFQNIAWSTELVLVQTLAIADRLSISYGLLKTLSDIDRPEDLVHVQDYSIVTSSLRVNNSRETCSNSKFNNSSAVN